MSLRVWKGTAWFPLTTTRGSSGRLRSRALRFTLASQQADRPGGTCVGPEPCGPSTPGLKVLAAAFVLMPPVGVLVVAALRLVRTTAHHGQHLAATGPEE